MRADVKLGIVISLGCVLVGGAYYVYRDGQAVPVDLSDGGSVSPGTGDAGALSDQRAGAASRNAGAVTPNASTTEPATDVARQRGSARRRAVSADAGRRAAAGASKRSPVGQGSDAMAAARGGRAAPRTSAPPKRTASRPTGVRGRPARPPSSQPRATPAGGVDPTAKPTGRVAEARGRPARRVGRQAPVNPAAGAQASPTDRPVARSSVVANPKSSRDAAGAAARGAVPPASGDRAGDDPPIAVDLHRVQPGETLRTLAVTYYGDARFESLLRRHNRSITDPNRLRAGSVVRIPAAPSSDAAARSARRSPALVGTRDARRKESAAPNGSKIRTPPRTYRVKPGDSFYSIARDVLGDAGLWNELFELNKALVHGDAKLLQIGQVISLPPKSVRKSR